MSNNRSSIDDSPKEDGKNELLFRCLLHLALSLSLSLSFSLRLEHDWYSYLQETNSEPAPASNFRQVSQSRDFC